MESYIRKLQQGLLISLRWPWCDELTFGPRIVNERSDNCYTCALYSGLTVVLQLDAFRLVWFMFAVESSIKRELALVLIYGQLNAERRGSRLKFLLLPFLPLISLNIFRK